MSENSFLCEFHAQVSQIVLLVDLTILHLITTVRAKMSENSYLQSLLLKYHKSCSLLIWPFYSLLLLYEQNSSQSSYLHEFCAQVSQIASLPELTVLRLNTTV